MRATVPGDPDLETLESRGLIALVATYPELEYLFRHWLLQDAAYGSLLKQERRLLHGRVGTALEEIYPDRHEELAGLLAMHFEQAGESDKAIDYYIEAGHYGQRRKAVREAFAAFDRAAALVRAGTGQDDDRSTRRRVEIDLGRAEAGHTFRPLADTLADLEAVIARAERLADPALAARAHMLAAFARLIRGTSPEDPIVQRSLLRLGEMADELEDESLRALPIGMVGMNRVFTGPVAEGVRDLEESVPVLERTHDQIGAAFARGALAMGYAALGDFRAADAAAINAIEVAARGDVVAQLEARIAESVVRLAEDQLEEAVTLAQSCVARSEETGVVLCAMVSSWVLGDAYHRLGRLEDAREAFDRSAAIARVVEHPVVRPMVLAWQATTASALGDPVPASFDEALHTARSIGNRVGEAGILAKRAEALAGQRQWEAAFADFRTAAEMAELEHARPALARLLLAWGQALGAAGRGGESEATLRRSLTLFEELGLERESARVRSALATDSPREAP